MTDADFLSLLETQISTIEFDSPFYINNQFLVFHSMKLGNWKEVTSRDNHFVRCTWPPSSHLTCIFTSTPARLTDEEKPFLTCMLCLLNSEIIILDTSELISELPRIYNKLTLCHHIGYYDIVAAFFKEVVSLIKLI